MGWVLVSEKLKQNLLGENEVSKQNCNILSSSVKRGDGAAKPVQQQS